MRNITRTCASTGGAATVPCNLNELLTPAAISGLTFEAVTDNPYLEAAKLTSSKFIQDRQTAVQIEMRNWAEAPEMLYIT